MRVTKFEQLRSEKLYSAYNLEKGKYYRVVTECQYGAIVRGINQRHETNGRITYAVVLHSESSEHMFISSDSPGVVNMKLEEIEHGRVTTEW